MRGALTAAAVARACRCARRSIAGQRRRSRGHVKLTTRVRGRRCRPTSTSRAPSAARRGRDSRNQERRRLPEGRRVRGPAASVPSGDPPGARNVRRRTCSRSPAGRRSSFPNDDPVFHNVFSLSSASTFDLGRYPRGQSKTATFTKAGLVKVYCHIHSHMSASILVLDHPYFTIPELDGTFTLPNVPAWRLHDRRLARARRRANRHGDRRAGRSASVDLSLPVEDQRSDGPAARPGCWFRTIAVTFVTAALLLAVIFVVVLLSVRNQVRQTVRANLESSQRMFAAIQRREQRELRLQAANVAESPTLKAAVDTYAAESQTGDAGVRAHSCSTRSTWSSPRSRSGSKRTRSWSSTCTRPRWRPPAAWRLGGRRPSACRSSEIRRHRRLRRRRPPRAAPRSAS